MLLRWVPFRAFYPNYSYAIAVLARAHFNALLSYSCKLFKLIISAPRAFLTEKSISFRERDAY